MSLVDFKEVAAAALDMAPILLAEWLGGSRHGREWHGATKANGGLGDSWKVNLETGNWGGFASGERGLDLVSLYAALNHIKQSAALKQVAAIVGVTDRPVRVLERSREPTERAAEPIPLSAPEVTAHPSLGAPVAVYRYGTAFWVVRYEKNGEKAFLPRTWRNGKWSTMGYPEPRPLYNLSDLEKEPTASVIVVEGEKAADALTQVMGAYIIVTWANGANAVHKNNWAPLAGRDVLIWPDADVPGTKAGAEVAEELVKVGAARVRVISVDDHTDGWDAADAVAEGWDAKRIAEWAKGRTRVVFPKTNGAAPHLEDEPMPDEIPADEPMPDEIPADEPMPDEIPADLPATIAPTVIEAGAQDDSAVVSWASMGLDTNEGGAPHATVANVSMILRAHPYFAGRIWYDTFTDQIRTTLAGCEPRRWNDSDTLNATVLIQHSLRLNKVKIDMVNSGVEHAARLHGRNSLTNWLDSLEWDGIQRLETWLQDTLGCEHNEYSIAVAVNWPIAMVARAYVPGCKVDTMPVLEGMQGLSKSTFLEVLGGDWYGSLQMAFGEKDFLQAIQGRWLIEIPDMTGFSKREHTQILATITTRRDIYRRSYGHFTEEHPRVAIFAATSETSDYLQDVRGRRRYWPLRCTDIDIDALRGMRDMVFAEAVDRYRDGAKWYRMPAQADAEQLERAAPDLWTDAVLNQAEIEWAAGNKVVSTRLLAGAPLDIPLGKQTDAERKRIGRILRRAGWDWKHTNTGGIWIKRERHLIP